MIPILVDERAILLHGDASKIANMIAPESIDAIVTDPPAGIAFMGKSWDTDKGGRDAWIAWLRDIMREALRVLKPGGHALVWALPRTSHRTATAVEDAGFEIRDVGIHLFGTGFPKSLDVSKAIDKANGDERPVIGKHPNPGSTRGRIAMGDGWQDAPDITAAASAAWSGWGTALKPAAEHWVLARKPLAGTVAANVLAHGTGALNIEACRIETTDDLNGGAYSGTRRPAESPTAFVGRGIGEHVAPSGRWPAHVTLDEEAAAALDAQSGGASRFFYVAKGSPSEKDAGLDHLPARTGGEATDREEGSAGLNSPRAGAGRTGGRRNHHPTVKSVALMRWLVRLITPPGGVVLDMFAGSGTTGVAALAEGASFVGVELTDEYLPILEGRIRHALKGTPVIYLDNLEAFADLCRMRNMYGLYVSSGSWFDEIADRTDGIPPSCPLICLYLPTAQAFADGCAVFLFDTDEECRAAFDRVLGDDHRAPIQYRTYAITCSNLGDLMDENT